MILVTGGAGVMGSRLVRGLVEAGNSVRVLTLPNDPLVKRLDGLDVDIRYGDVSDRTSIETICEGVKTVYHLAAVLLSPDPAGFQRVNVNGTSNLVELSVKAGVEHFVLVSSISVTYPYTTPYSLSKRECERIVKDQGTMRYTIVRPTLAYNEFGGEEFMMYMDYLKRFPVVPFIGRGRALKNPVHVDDLMRGFLAIPNNPKSYGKTYAFSGSEEISIWDLGKDMLRHQGISKPFLPVPVWLCKILAAIMGATMKKPPLSWNAIAGITQDANPDWSQAKADLDYKPIGIREGLDRCFGVPQLKG
jgi:NADH dehydrogenase